MNTDVLRPLAATDSLPALTALLHAAYARLAGMGLNYTAVDQSVEETQRRVEGGQCFVVERAGAVVATATVHGAFDPDRDLWARATPWYFRTDVAHLHQFAVEPSIQGGGLGARLLQACEGWAQGQGHRAIALDTAVPAEHLRRWYAQGGFEEVDEVQWDGKRYRSVVMVKALASDGPNPHIGDLEHRAARVRTLWACVQARDWAGMRALLRDDARMCWPVTGEHFGDADAIVRVNALYPEGWTIHVASVEPLVGRDVHSLVEVTQDGRRFFGHSRFRFDAQERIAEVVEHWANVEIPPAWRTAERLGNYRREP